MSQPQVMNITCINGSERWESGEVVSLEGIAQYIERDCECMMTLNPEESRLAYGRRLLKVLAEEIRAFKR